MKSLAFVLLLAVAGCASSVTAPKAPTKKVTRDLTCRSGYAVADNSGVLVCTDSL